MYLSTLLNLHWKGERTGGLRRLFDYERRYSSVLMSAPGKDDSMDGSIKTPIVKRNEGRLF